MVDSDRYNPTSQVFHWVTALTVLAAYAIGLLREELPRGDFRNGLLTLHMSLGLLVFGLTFLRLAWRSRHPAPAVIAKAPVARFAANAAHWALYAAMFAIPLVGLVSAWTKGRLVDLFWILPLSSPFILDKTLGETLEHLHGFAAHALMALAGLHALAAIGHHAYLKDATLLRMLPVRVGLRLQARRQAAYKAGPAD